ncbi:hypothetical protein Zmor_016296 [Zophobas morio]|jgi:hypothetical protein|uniref:F-box domain-containing protein n=1 Tax=Zophobas morio TaxID=2755281 RepID=A0AA38HGC8_9CUCU|nr:hypothetical protein Zmor_016296 [Zophobas morio]
MNITELLAHATLEEIYWSDKNISTKKASFPDGTTNPMLKHLPLTALTYIVKLMDMISLLNVSRTLETFQSYNDPRDAHLLSFGQSLSPYKPTILPQKNRRSPQKLQTFVKREAIIPNVPFGF